MATLKLVLVVLVMQILEGWRDVPWPAQNAIMAGHICFQVVDWPVLIALVGHQQIEDLRCFAGNFEFFREPSRLGG